MRINSVRLACAAFAIATLGLTAALDSSRAESPEAGFQLAQRKRETGHFPKQAPPVEERGGRPHGQEHFPKQAPPDTSARKQKCQMHIVTMPLAKPKLVNGQWVKSGKQIVWKC